jgi:hypothetical protein
MLIIETIATKLLSALKITHSAIIYVSEYPMADFLKLAVLSFIRPVFKMYYFIFKFVYFRQQQRLVSLCLDDETLHIDKIASPFDSCLIDNGRVSSTDERLANIDHGINRSKSRG